MPNIKFKTRVIISFISAIIVPITITVTFLIGYGFHLFKDDSDSFSLNYETTSEINSYIRENWDIIKDDYQRFDAGLKYIILDKPIELRILDTNGSLIYDSTNKELPDQFKMFTQIVPGLDGGNHDQSNDLLSYTIGEYVRIHGEIMGIKLYTYPPPPDFLTKLFKLVVFTLLVGFLSVFSHVCLSVFLISRRVTKPLKELYLATSKISRNDFNFDITYTANDELGALCNAFQTMKDKLKDYKEREIAVMDTKKQLLAAISHDLRTPMTSIQGYVEALQDGIASDPQKFRQYLAIIQNKVESLNRLIDDLFQLSKLDLGQFDFNIERVHVKTFIQGLYVDLKEEAGWQNINLVKQFINIDFAIIDADAKRLEQTLNNIVFNAFKYCNNTVVIQCSTSNDSVYFSIIDDGVGIPEDEIPFVFDKFYKVEKARTTCSGSGLGLAIAKSMVTQMGGEIKAENNKNGPGATFTVSLPLIK